MVHTSKEIADEELPIFYNTELNKIMEKHAPEKTKTITLRPEQMDVRRCEEHEEESEIIRQEI